MLLIDSFPESEKFELDGYHVEAWAAERHGTLEFALQRQEGSLTRFAIVDATPLEDAEPRLMVQVFARAELGDRFIRRLISQQVTARLDYDLFDTWFEDARARADGLGDRDLTQVRLVTYNS